MHRWRRAPDRSRATERFATAAPRGAAAPRVPVNVPAGVPEGNAPRPAVSRNTVFGICSLALFMAAIDATIVATALHTIDRDLHSTINWAGWVITIYQLGSLLAMPLAGKISDQFGRRRVFLVSVILFSVTSLACGFATNIYMLVVLRSVQSIGGGSLMPSASGIVSDWFGRDRDRALGMFSTILPMGGIVGPIFGGLFVTYWTWRGIFFINVPIGVALVLLTLKYIPDSRATPEGALDVRGVTMLGVGVLSAMFGITMLGSSGTSWIDPVVDAPLVLSAAALTAFWRHTKRAAAPFIPMRLLSGQGFGVMNVLNFIYGSATIGFGALVPLYAVDRFDISRLDSGTLLTARGVGMVAVAALATMLLRRTGYRLPMVVGFSLVTLGLMLMSVGPPAGIGAYLWLSVGAAVSGVGMGFSAPASNNATMQLAPDQIAAIAGLRGMFRTAGGIFAVAITTAILNRSIAPGMAQAHVFWVMAVLLVVVVIPLVYLIPDHRGSW